jgi:type II secretory pathway predicted ATPase ExeA
MNNETNPPNFDNPFRPGAGHMPPYLAGRETEKEEFARLLRQTTILQNMVLTGLRGVGKTVLLDTLRPTAIAEGWGWVGTDLSESSSLSEENMATRLLTDLSVFTSTIVISQEKAQAAGFTGSSTVVEHKLSFDLLHQIYNSTPGLVADKLKRVLELTWQSLQGRNFRGIVFAYDEAQTLADHRAKDQYPLSVLLDVFQSIQRKNIPFMLLLTGLPTLYPKLVEARTFSERMFHIVTLDRLNQEASRQAIVEPIKKNGLPGSFNDVSIKSISDVSGGYPYFIQFICREVFDLFIQQSKAQLPMSVPVNEIVHKLDSDFFSGRWSRATDRQRDLLMTVASLNDAEDPNFQFSVQDLVAQSKSRTQRPFSPSHANQLFGQLGDAGLIYKNRHGRYTFAVPLLGRFIRRQISYKEMFVSDARP